MKNAILGVIGAFLIIYTSILGLGIYNTCSRQEELENILAQVLKQTLENGYLQADYMNEEQLRNEIIYRLGSDSDVEVQIHCMDMEKGIISVTVKETFVQLNGMEKCCEWTKTAIMDRENIQNYCWEEGED